MEYNHGFKLDTIVPDEHYILGGYKSLGGTILQPDRDWRPFVPAHQETQNLGFETNACTNFGTANALEILLNRLFKDTRDFSDRWYAKASGTSVASGGNSPHTVAEFARLSGLVNEEKWPFDVSIESVEEFYADFPKELYTTASKLLDEFTLKHEWVPSDAQSLYDALQYSPLGFSTYAWVRDGDMYYRPQGSSDTHWVVLIYAEWEKYWLVLDSYKDENALFKKIRWNSLPMQAKRYAITRSPHIFLKNLGFQMVDPEVEYLQKALVSLNYLIPHAVTNVYGIETRSAVAAFQNDHGIFGNAGMNVGPKTRNALNIALNSTKPFGGSLVTAFFALFASV